MKSDNSVTAMESDTVDTSRNRGATLRLEKGLVSDSILGGTEDTFSY